VPDGLVRAFTLLAALTITFVCSGIDVATVAASPAVATINTAHSRRPIPTGFLGLSLELNDVRSYAGMDAASVDPVLLQLIRNLAPGQRPVLRLGGDTTDWTWWPVPHMRRPPRVRYSLNDSWVQTVHTLAARLRARLIVGINLQANSGRLAGSEAKAMLHGIGRNYIQALELGNEPELYGTAAWFRTATGARSQRSRYDFRRYVRDFSNVARSLPPGDLAGPSTGSPQWMAHVRDFLAREPRVKLLTLHRYPLKHCTPHHVLTPDELLSDAASKGLADSVAYPTSVARAHNVAVRVDEINAVSCGGQRGISDTFAAALWSLDTLFEMARVGIDGVNIHTRSGSSNELFTIRSNHGRWSAVIHPAYYGLLLFARAAPPGSRMLRITRAVRKTIHIWATQGSDGRVRVVLINKNPTRTRTVDVRLQHAAGPATLQLLHAPSVNSTDGVTLGGQTFGSTSTTGTLTTAARIITVPPHSNNYAVRLPAASAAMLTIPAGSQSPGPPVTQVDIA
jgi:hypothetical protein